MPISRRRRANPPDQPENNNHVSEQPENGGELFSQEPSSEASPVEAQAQDAELQAQPQPQSQSQPQPVEENTPSQPLTAPPVVQPTQPEVSSDQAPTVAPSTGASSQPPFHSPDAVYNPHITYPTPPSTLRVPPTPPFPPIQMSQMPHPTLHQNGEHFDRSDRGERFDRGERVERMEHQEYPPTIEGGRRTPRGELFRRPPQPPTAQPMPQPPAPPPLQAPTHEITLPLGNLLHLAYNPAYTGSDEARSALLQKLSRESKAGGRARCWSCGSLAIVYDRWSTRSKTFGEVGIAFCEICGVWSVM